MSFDHAAWLSRAREFVRSAGHGSGPFAEVRCEVTVGEPAAAGEIRYAQQRWSDMSLSVPGTVAELDAPPERAERTLPGELARFYAEAASGCRCTYVCDVAPGGAEALRGAGLDGMTTVYGGPDFFSAFDLPEHVRACHDWAADTWVADDETASRIWRAAVPFAYLRNGDYLGLDTTDGSDDPPVVYLCHDDESSVLAPSFTGFLTAWERLCYVGPEAWMLEPFRGPDGVLDPSTGRAAGLRRLLVGA